MPDTSLEQSVDVPFTFRVRPTATPCEIRPVWRLHCLTLLLDKCWGAQATLEQLHVLNWAIRTDDTRSRFLQFLRGERSPTSVIVRYDPSLNRAVHFAYAEGIVIRRADQLPLVREPDNGVPPYRLVLSSKGKELQKVLRRRDDCFIVEKEFLDSIPHKITQKQIEMLFTWGRVT